MLAGVLLPGLVLSTSPVRDRDVVVDQLEPVGAVFLRIAVDLLPEGCMLDRVKQPDLLEQVDLRNVASLHLFSKVGPGDQLSIPVFQDDLGEQAAVLALDGLVE